MVSGTGACVLAIAGAFFIQSTYAQSGGAADGDAQMRALHAQVKAGPERRLGTQLTLMQQRSGAAPLSSQHSSAVQSKLDRLRVLRLRDGYVSVSAYPTTPANAAALRTTLETRGMLDAKLRGNAQSGAVSHGAARRKGRMGDNKKGRPGGVAPAGPEVVRGVRCERSRLAPRLRPEAPGSAPRP